MRKKAALSTLQTAILVLALVIVVLLVFVAPLGKSLASFLDFLGGTKCEETGKSAEAYREQITDFLDANKNEEAVRLYQESKECFPEEKQYAPELVPAYKEVIELFLSDPVKIGEVVELYYELKKLSPSEKFSDVTEYQLSLLRLPRGVCYYADYIKDVQTEEEAVAFCKLEQCVPSVTNNKLDFCATTQEEMDGCFIRGYCTYCTNYRTCISTKMEHRCIWDGANKRCEKLSGGWNEPTKEDIIYALDVFYELKPRPLQLKQAYVEEFKNEYLFVETSGTVCTKADNMPPRIHLASYAKFPALCIPEGARISNTNIERYQLAIVNNEYYIRFGDFNLGKTDALSAYTEWIKMHDFMSKSKDERKSFFISQSNTPPIKNI